MKIKHEHIESVLLALAAEKGQAWVANAITEEYLRQGGGELPLVPGKDWNNQQNIYHRWLKGETEAQREKIQKLIPAILAILPRELRHRLCIFDTLARRALLAAQEALSTAIDAHDDAVQAVYRKAHFSGGGSSDDSVIVHEAKVSMLFVLILSNRAASYGAIMAALPYMQLYIADYLADTMHLSAEEHGAYLLLMFNYWQTGKPIPKNRLAKIA